MILFRDIDTGGGIHLAPGSVLSGIFRNVRYVFKFLVRNDDIAVQNNVYLIIPIKHTRSCGKTIYPQIRSVYRPFQFICSRCGNHIAPDIVGIGLCRI